MDKPTYKLELELKNKGYQYIIGVDEAGRGCEKPDAEILTDSGWKYYTEVKAGSDKVLSYTVDGNIEWQSIDRVVEKNFDGKLIELKNRSVHMLVTPDHYFDVLRRTFKRDKLDCNKLKMTGYKFRGRKCVRDLVSNDFIPRGGVWKGTNKKFFVLPSIGKSIYNGYDKDYGKKYIPIDVWVSFIGIYLAEGNCEYNEKTYTYRVTISQSRQASRQNYEKIWELLRKLPFKINSHAVGFTINDKQLSAYIHQFGNVYTKFIPNFIKVLEPSLLNLFINWMILGDGTCYRSKNRKEVCTYYTVSNNLRDDFEEVLLKAGWTYKTNFRDPRDAYIRGRLIKKENQVGCFEIRLRRNNKISCKYLHKKKIQYKGKVFCLSLPKHHNFYIRRSGSGYFTGNSLVGPVVAAAVNISDGFDTSGINDSKKLSSKKRELFYNKITEACTYAIAEVDEKLIDQINIREATKLAMRKVIYNMPEADFALVDGNFVPEFIDVPAQPVIGGDGLSVSIAAASIVAKVWRDKIMDVYHSKWPAYGFNTNRGYGTRHHREVIEMIGPCSIHRKSFRRVKEYV